MSASKKRTSDGCGRWAEEEFGSAELGNTLRTERAVAMAAEALRRPAGLLTSVYEGASLEGAYRFAENDKISVSELCAAACRAAAKRAEEMEFVFVPVDGSSLTLPEYEGEAQRDVGSVGSFAQKGTGLLMMNAVAISPQGVPLGLFAQSWWKRTHPMLKPHVKRKLGEKETRFWFEAMGAGAKAWAETNPTTRLWFQLDRGGDFREMLKWAESAQQWITVVLHRTGARPTNNRPSTYGNASSPRQSGALSASSCLRPKADGQEPQSLSCVQHKSPCACATGGRRPLPRPRSGRCSPEKRESPPTAASLSNGCC